MISMVFKSGLLTFLTDPSQWRPNSGEHGSLALRYSLLSVEVAMISLQNIHST